LRQIALSRDVAAGCWQVRWQIDNRGGDRLEVAAVRLPHGQFKSAEQRFLPAVRLAAGESAQFDIIVRCLEPPGPVTENAFVIFQCRWHGAAWRIFVRIRVDVDAAGEPDTVTQLISTQKVGFSGISN